MMRLTPGGLEDLQREIGRILNLTMPVLREEHEAAAGSPPAQASPVFWTPPVDVLEFPDAIQLVIELPGINLPDIGIHVEGNTLLIKGERKYEPGTGEKHYNRIERHYGPFQRQFNLPQNVRPDGIKASLKNGLLTVSLPKVEEAKSRKIQIQAE